MIIVVGGIVFIISSIMLFLFVRRSGKAKAGIQDKIELLIAENARYESRLSSSLEYINKLENEKNNIQDDYRRAQVLLSETQQALELKKQEMREFEKRVDDWEKSRQEAVTQAKAAIFETASKLSEQLIEKHKNETKESEEKLSGNARKLQEQFEKVVESVAVLNQDIKSSKETVDHVKRALLSPAGAGNLAEITLENILKASGLEHERDFVMQYSFSINQDNKRLRPDAIVFLPANNIMIIDSKASKYFTEITQNDSAVLDSEMNNKLKMTMRKHLAALSDKNYHEYLREHFKDRKINHISNVMFLPSEAAVEKISQIDKEFLSMAWQKDIFPVGSSGLINILAHTKFQMSLIKQEENQNLIVEEIRKLLGSLSNMCEYAKKLGVSLYSASNNFDKFAGSLNVNLLPKARNLEKLGVHLHKNKSIPTSIDRFTILTSDKAQLIEVDKEAD